MKRARLSLDGGALPLAGLVVGGLLLAPYCGPAQSAAHKVLSDALLAAGTIIFVDGAGYPDGSTRMDTEIDGEFQYQPCSAPCPHLTTPAPGTTYDFINNTAVYPATLGLFSGLGAPSGNQSVADGRAAIAQQITGADTPVTVVGYSEGALPASDEVTAPVAASNVSFVLIGDADRPNGGILARLPTGTYIPLMGLTANGPTSSNGAPVVMVTQEYDAAADAPAYPLNVVADVNAVLAFYYLHGDYQDVDPDAPGNIVTTSPNGNMTDILVPAPVGQLPLELPLAAVGVPQPILVALDPALRAVVDTAYDRTSNPAQQVEFALLPPPSAWAGDVQSVVSGVLLTVQELPGAVVASVAPVQLPSVPGLTSPQTTSPVSSLPAALTAAATLPASPMQPTAPTHTTTPHTATTAGTLAAIQNSPTPPSTPQAGRTSWPAWSAPASTPATMSGTRKDPAGNTAPPSTGAAGTPLSDSHPLPDALAGVTSAFGSLTGSSAKSGPTADASSGRHRR